jgi:hypothetical protein
MIIFNKEYAIATLCKNAMKRVQNNEMEKISFLHLAVILYLKKWIYFAFRPSI